MSHRPKCPNHHVEMDRTDNPKIWICPISDARFEVDVDQADTKKKFDKFGREIIDYTIKSIDEE